LVRILAKELDLLSEADRRSLLHLLLKGVENLKDNLTNSMVKGILSDESIKAADAHIQNRLALIQKLAGLEKQPIGAAIGESIPGQADSAIARIRTLSVIQLAKDPTRAIANPAAEDAAERLSPGPPTPGTFTVGFGSQDAATLQLF
jgi:hypothetical protein